MPFSARLPFQCLLVSLSFLHSTRASSSVCYYPDGSQATDYVYVPCVGSNFSSCCIPSEGDVCMSNGLCYYTSAPYLFRGACTDQSWKSDKCPSYCNSKNADGWEELTSCGGTKYCCSSDSDCCTKPNLVFDVGVPSVINDYGSTASLSSLSALPTTWQKSVITAPATITDSSSRGSATTATANSSSSSSSSLTKSTATGIGKGAIIGIVAGAGIFILLAIIAGLLFCCLRKGSRSSAAKNKANQSATSLINMQDQSGAQRPMTATAAAPYGQAGDAKYAHDGWQQQQQQQPWQPGPPAYQPPYGGVQAHQVTPVGPNGQGLVELQSPIVAPRGSHGKVFHELG